MFLFILQSPSRSLKAVFMFPLLPLFLLSFLSKINLISTLLSPSFPPFLSSFSWLLRLSVKVSPLVVSPIIQMSCLPHSWRSCWVFFVLLICFLRVAKVSNTKQPLWQFLAVLLKTVCRLAVQHDAVYCWGHWIPLETQGKYGKITADLIRNNSQDYTTNAPLLMHLELLFASVYRQVIAPWLCYQSGVAAAPRASPTPSSMEMQEGQRAQPVFSSSLLPAELLPCCSALLDEWMLVAVFSCTLWVGFSLVADLKTRWSDLSG